MISIATAATSALATSAQHGELSPRMAISGFGSIRATFSKVARCFGRGSFLAVFSSRAISARTSADGTQCSLDVSVDHSGGTRGKASEPSLRVLVGAVFAGVVLVVVFFFTARVGAIFVGAVFRFVAMSHILGSLERRRNRSRSWQV